MMSGQNKKSVFHGVGSFPWYPVLFAVYAPLALLSNNLGQLDYRDGLPSILVTFFASLFLLLLMRLILGDWPQAGSVSAVVILLMVTYGHVYTAIKNYEVFGVIVGRHRYLIGIWLALTIFGVWWSVRKSFQVTSLAPTMNLVGIFLLLYPSFQIVSFFASSAGQQRQVTDTLVLQTKQHNVKLPRDRSVPDVYYIILDAYGRSDVLLNNFGYDNSLFLESLRHLGFYVADCAQSNYSKTDLSLSSSMNLNYVTALGDEFLWNSTDRLPLWNLIKNNEVKAIFESLGYTTVAFETGYDFTEIEGSDEYFSAPDKGFNGFENLYIQTTVFTILNDAGLLRKMQLTPADRKRELVLYKLAEMEMLPSSLPSPKFVFLHLVIPHQPFVFGPDGDPFVIPERVYKGRTYYPTKDYVLGYRNQAIFISQKILETIKTIQQDSLRPPIIILQGDHGPSHFDQSDRMKILSAYYFPGQDVDFYSSITPVNTFRLLFNSYFDANFELLEDVSYYSEYPYAYKFEIAPNTCQDDAQ